MPALKEIIFVRYAWIYLLWEISAETEKNTGENFSKEFLA